MAEEIQDLTTVEGKGGQSDNMSVTEVAGGTQPEEQLNLADLPEDTAETFQDVQVTPSQKSIQISKEAQHLSEEPAVSKEALEVGDGEVEGKDEVVLDGEKEKETKEDENGDEIENIKGTTEESKMYEGNEDDTKGEEVKVEEEEIAEVKLEREEEEQAEVEVKPGEGGELEVQEGEKPEQAEVEVKPEGGELEVQEGEKPEQAEVEVKPGEVGELEVQEGEEPEGESMKKSEGEKGKPEEAEVPKDEEGKPAEKEQISDKAEEPKDEEGKPAEKEQISDKAEEPEDAEKEPMEGEKSEIEEKPEGEDKKEVEKKEEKGKDIPEDFVMRKESSLQDIGLIPEIQFEYSSSEEEEEEEEEVEEEEEEGIDREAAIEKYKILQGEGRPVVKKNIILLKKLAEHFKKRKMEHIYKTPEPYSADKEMRYHKQLLAFEEIRTIEKKEREVITKELEEMKKQRDELVGELKVEFDNLIQREREIGIGLINTKTGKVIPDRVVEQLLSRQTRKIKEVNDVRLGFIKLRDRVAAKEAQLRSLETFGENLHLIDYEQLRMENQTYADKIEERDEELQRLRNKATSAIQIMAHMREKSYATDEKMDELCEMLEYTETEVDNTRGYVTDLKKRRDFLRSETLRLRCEAGLLTQPRLLRDFALSIDEATHLSAQVQNLKNSFYDQKRSLSNIRKSIEAHTSIHSTGKTISVASGPRFQQRKSSIHTEQNQHETYTSHSKAQGLHTVTSDLIRHLSSVGNTRGRTSRLQSKHSISLAPVVSIRKGRPSFFPISYKVYLPAEKKLRLPDLPF